MDLVRVVPRVLAHPWTWVVLATVPLLAGCGGGGSNSSGPSEAPVIKSFAVTRNSSTTFTVAVDAFDAQADLFGGACRLTADGFTGQIDVPITRLAPGANATDPESDVTCSFFFQSGVPSGTSFNFHMVLIDTKGNVSNSADFVQTRETRADALAPPVESGRLEGSGEGLLGPIERLR